MTTTVRSMRSLHAFTHGVNGQGGREAASAAASSPAAGRRLHTQLEQELNPSRGDAGATARAGVDRGTAKGELWR